MSDLAWLDDGDRRFIARTDGHLPAESAITRLIQGIYERDPAQARRILRHRIRATVEEPTEMCWGMVRVAAKRLDRGVREEEHPLAPGQELIEVGCSGPGPGTFGDGTEFSAEAVDPMSIAKELATRVSLHELRHQSDRKIAALLLSEEGRILAWAINSSARNKTLHAEVSLVQSYCRRTGELLPAGSRIYTTLKSCKMCAGMIWSAAREPLSLRVYFDQDDPGPKARATVLNAGSFERTRAARMAGRPELRLACLEFGP